jgi:hypothetical protein
VLVCVANEECCATRGVHTPGAAPRMVQLIASRIEKEINLAKRIDLWYLVDSVVQCSLKPGRPGCGPDTPAGTAFPRAVAAALRR